MSASEHAPLLEEMVPLAEIRSIKLDLMLAGDMEKYSVVNIVEGSDLTSSKLGLPNPSSLCETCGSENIKHCEGHFGTIKLPSVIYHPYFISELVQLLNQICPGCKSIRQDVQKDSDIPGIPAESPNISKCLKSGLSLEDMFNALNDAQKKLLMKLIPSSQLFNKNHEVKKNSEKTLDKQESRYEQQGCKYCCKHKNSGEWYPRMKFKTYKEKSGSKSVFVVVQINEKELKQSKNKPPNLILAKDYWNFVPEDHHQEFVDGMMILSPFQVFSLLKNLNRESIEKYVSRRELLFLSCIPVTSNCHRISERSLPHANGTELVFDQRTKAYKSLLCSGRKLNEHQLQHFISDARITDNIAGQSFNCLSSNNLQTGGSNSMKPESTKKGLKWIKEVVLGKRSDHTFNMIAVGDPKIRLGEVGLPFNVCQRLLVAERFFSWNTKKLNKNWNLHFAQQKNASEHVALPMIGDVLRRPLEDGDLVLTYRPPSVHQHSLIAFKVKILPTTSVVSINPLCCSPFKGDFDGDILFGYVPQSIQCRVELDQLVSLDRQMLNGQDGSNLVYLTHDSLTAAYLLTSTDVFLDKLQMQQLQMLCPRQLDFPAIMKSASSPTPVWTGWQLFSSLLPLDMNFVSCSESLEIRKGDVLLCPSDSFWLQNKSCGVFSEMFKCYGSKALDFLFSAQDVLCEWISARGFTVSLNDLYICSDQQMRRKLMEEVTFGFRDAKYACHVKSMMMDPQIMSILYRELDDLSSPNKEIFCMKGSKLKKYGFTNKHSAAAFKKVLTDIQALLFNFSSKENALLQMILSGSKGSFTKLFQQGVSLGQHSFDYSLPLDWWFRKSCGLSTVVLDETECGKNDTSDVVVNSFLDGLNPLECFLHAASARSSFFSENAQLPGTMNQRFMFHMRDLYLAYDGTVRNPYGQQIVQFSYDVHEETHIRNKFCNPDQNPYSAIALGGQPVGVLASCSISEAAYGGLDQPAVAFESSPLINFKKVFHSRQQNISEGQTISLALSKNLKRWPYGFEYAALEVQSYLERILLSDIVKTVIIVYAGQEVTGSVCPWISHFHLDKHRMFKKNLTAQYVAEVLDRKFNLPNNTSNPVNSKLYILCRKCILIDQRLENDDTVCFTVNAEATEFAIEFDDVRDVLVPLLLQTVVKGFNEYPKVDILWDDKPNSSRKHEGHSGQLFLQVSLSKTCNPKRCWGDLQSVCIPIMNLIDWDCSHPNGVSEICSTHGVESAWLYLFKTMKAATAELGRIVHNEHLHLVADCLTVTGQFNGLNPKGIRLQRSYSGVSSPFMQACSSRPASTFVAAARKGETDFLLGTVDAIAWGKEVPVGTGGSFDIKYSGKVHSIDKPENPYQSLEIFFDCKQDYDLKKHCKCSSDVYKSKASLTNFSSMFIYGENKKSCTDESLKKRKSYLNLERKPDKQVMDMHCQLQKILHQNPIDAYLDEQDTSFVTRSLNFHPNSAAKIGSGVQKIKIGYHLLHPTSRCFFVVRKDGTTEDFSFKKCVIGAAAAAEQNLLDCNIMLESNRLHSSMI